MGPKLANEIDNGEMRCAEEKCVEKNPNSIILGTVESKEIINVVNKCTSKISEDWNDIDMFLVKKIINEIVDPLTHICNLSFKTGTFPDKMKVAKVIPLYKDGDKHLFTNYRPVSLLSQFSKIIEKLFVTRLDRFIEKTIY